MTGELNWLDDSKRKQFTKLSANGNYFAFSLTEWFKGREITVDNGGKESMYIAMIAIPAIYEKMGAEGQVSHSENGISRTWEPDGWFADVAPYCEVL